MERRTVLRAIAASAATIAIPSHAQETYPNKPVRMIIPYATGQSADVFGRLLANSLGRVWGQQMYVENKGGGASIPGMLAGRDSPPDGYTITIGGSGPLGVNPGLYREKLPYDAMRDFTPVHGLFIAPLVVLAHPNTKFNSLADVVTAARRAPGEKKWGVAGLATSPHLAAELIKATAKVDIVSVPYRGSGPMLTDLLGGQIQLGIDTISAAISYIKSGHLKPLAITSSQRVAVLPELRTVAESGYPGFEALGWAGLIVPAKTTRNVVTTIERAVHVVMTAPEFQAELTQRGAIPDTRGAEAWGSFVRSEIPKWDNVIAASKIAI